MQLVYISPSADVSGAITIIKQGNELKEKEERDRISSWAGGKKEDDAAVDWG